MNQNNGYQNPPLSGTKSYHDQSHPNGYNSSSDANRDVRQTKQDKMSAQPNFNRNNPPINAINAPLNIEVVSTSNGHYVSKKNFLDAHINTKNSSANVDQQSGLKPQTNNSNVQTHTRNPNSQSYNEYDPNGFPPPTQVRQPANLQSEQNTHNLNNQRGQSDKNQDQGNRYYVELNKKQDSQNMNNQNSKRRSQDYEQYNLGNEEAFHPVMSKNNPGNGGKHAQAIDSRIPFSDDVGNNNGFQDDRNHKLGNKGPKNQKNNFQNKFYEVEEEYVEKKPVTSNNNNNSANFNGKATSDHLNNQQFHLEDPENLNSSSKNALNTNKKARESKEKESKVQTKPHIPNTTGRTPGENYLNSFENPQTHLDEYNRSRKKYPDEPQKDQSYYSKSKQSDLKSYQNNNDARSTNNFQKPDLPPSNKYEGGQYFVKVQDEEEDFNGRKKNPKNQTQGRKQLPTNTNQPSEQNKNGSNLPFGVNSGNSNVQSSTNIRDSQGQQNSKQSPKQKNKVMNKQVNHSNVNSSTLPMNIPANNHQSTTNAKGKVEKKWSDELDLGDRDAGSDFNKQDDQQLDKSDVKEILKSVLSILESLAQLEKDCLCLEQLCKTIGFVIGIYLNYEWRLFLEKSKSILSQIRNDAMNNIIITNSQVSGIMKRLETLKKSCLEKITQVQNILVEETLNTDTPYTRPTNNPDEKLTKVPDKVISKKEATVADASVNNSASPQEAPNPKPTPRTNKPLKLKAEPFTDPSIVSFVPSVASQSNWAYPQGTDNNQTKGIWNDTYALYSKDAKIESKVENKFIEQNLNYGNYGTFIVNPYLSQPLYTHSFNSQGINPLPGQINHAYSADTIHSQIQNSLDENAEPGVFEPPRQEELNSFPEEIGSPELDGQQFQGLIDVSYRDNISDHQNSPDSLKKPPSERSHLSPEGEENEQPNSEEFKEESYLASRFQKSGIFGRKRDEQDHIGYITNQQLRCLNLDDDDDNNEIPDSKQVQYHSKNGENRSKNGSSENKDQMDSPNVYNLFTGSAGYAAGNQNSSMAPKDLSINVERQVLEDMHVHSGSERPDDEMSANGLLLSEDETSFHEIIEGHSEPSGLSVKAIEGLFIDDCDYFANPVLSTENPETDNMHDTFINTEPGNNFEVKYQENEGKSKEYYSKDSVDENSSASVNEKNIEKLSKRSRVESTNKQNYGSNQNYSHAQLSDSIVDQEGYITRSYAGVPKSQPYDQLSNRGFNNLSVSSGHHSVRPSDGGYSNLENREGKGSFKVHSPHMEVRIEHNDNSNDRRKDNIGEGFQRPANLNHLVPLQSQRRGPVLQNDLASEDPDTEYHRDKLRALSQAAFRDTFAHVRKVIESYGTKRSSNEEVFTEEENPDGLSLLDICTHSSYTIIVKKKIERLKEVERIEFFYKIKPFLRTLLKDSIGKFVVYNLVSRSKCGLIPDIKMITVEMLLFFLENLWLLSRDQSADLFYKYVFEVL